MSLPSNSTTIVPQDSAFFSKNHCLFCRRFPELAQTLGIETEAKAKHLLSNLPDYYTLSPAKARNTDKATLSLAIQGTYVHSKYNPKEEARKIFSSEFFSHERIQRCCGFAGLGLGYLPLLYAETHPHAHISIIEPDVYLFLCFLSIQPLDSFFAHENLTLLIGTDNNDAAVFLASSGITEKVIFPHPVLTKIHKEWYDGFFALFKRNVSKNSINARTLKRFSTLWLKNTGKNAELLCEYAKISVLKGLFTHIPAVILAGGPSLTRHIALLKRHPRKYVIIAVDTAMRACIQNSITPDFILSFDPQYWNYLHTAGLDTSQSILISEASAFPAVLRQKYKAVFLAHSSVPFAQYFEPNPDKDTKLAAGGSVATTAWDFARYTGASPIIMAGLDLAFPHNQTHFTGSTFEENTHTASKRIGTAETAHYKSLHSAFPEFKPDYHGGKVLTDRRMLMYAWWFESTLANNPDYPTYNLQPEGVHIPGMPPCNEQTFTTLIENAPDKNTISRTLNARIQAVYSKDFTEKEALRRTALHNQLAFLLEDIKKLKKNAEKALRLCESLETASNTDRHAILKQLDTCEKEIRTSFAKDIISILFFDEDETEPDTSEYQQAQKVYRRIVDIAQTAYSVIQPTAHSYFYEK